jgi:hypothetical protein
MRHIVNFGLLFSFLTLAITGGMAFALPFSLVTTRVHIVFGATIVVLVGLHLLSRVTYFRMQLRGAARSQVSRLLLLVILAAWGLLLAGAWAGWIPFEQLVAQSYEARHRAEIVRASPRAGFTNPSSHQRMVARVPDRDADVALSLTIGLSKSIPSLPSMAVWAETSTGTMIETLYLDPALAYSDRPDWGGATTPRHHVLPLWRHRYTMVSGIDPSGEVDTATAATPTHSFTLDDYLVLGEDKQFVLCVEVNTPGDPNEHYPDPHIGQPSLLYTAYIEVSDAQQYALLELTGHGGGAEKSGAIQYDLDGCTSARQLVDLLLVKVAPVVRSTSP